MASSSKEQHHETTLPAAKTIRIIILETDRPHPDTESEKGSFGQILHHHFTKAGESHHPPLGVETDQIFVVRDQGGRIPTVDEMAGFDGLLITGSMYDAHGDNDWILELLEVLKDLWVKKPDFRFTEVCFGHQLLARLLGAEIGPAPTGDWELGHSRIKLHPLGQRLFRTKAGHVNLHQMHQDRVQSIPPLTYPAATSFRDTQSPDSRIDKDEGKVECWGYSEHTPIQGLYLRNRLFTTQAHLGFDEDMVKRQIAMRVESGGIKDLEHADRAKETADLEHDGLEVAKAVLRVFSFDDDGMFDKHGKLLEKGSPG